MRGGGSRKVGESTCDCSRLSWRERGVFKVRIEKEGGQQEHAECILLSLPAAGLNESQEKGEGPPGPFQLTKTAAQRRGEERSKVQWARPPIWVAS